LTKARYLLDTNIASYVIKGNAPAVDRRLARVAVTDVFISSVTEAELRYGVARRPAASQLEALVEDFLLTLTMLPWDSAAGKQYGELRATLEREGRTMGNLDMMIGSHALALGAVLVTNDRAFTRIRGPEGDGLDGRMMGDPSGRVASAGTANWNSWLCLRSGCFAGRKGCYQQESASGPAETSLREWRVIRRKPYCSISGGRMGSGCQSDAPDDVSPTSLSFSLRANHLRVAELPKRRLWTECPSSGTYPTSPTVVHRGRDRRDRGSNGRLTGV
jgi:tRNA(fMet)-specific endonuclease VapC